MVGFFSTTPPKPYMGNWYEPLVTRREKSCAFVLFSMD